MKKSFLTIAIPAVLLLSCSGNNSEPKKEEAATTPTASAADTKEAKEERNKQTALASVDALIKGDVDGALKDAAPDVADYGSGEMKPLKGLDSVKSMLKSWRSVLEDYKGENIVAMADGDRVAVFANWSGKFKDNFMGMKVKGKSFKTNDVDIFTFNSDGKVIEHRNVQSSAEMMHQLGVKY